MKAEKKNDKKFFIFYLVIELLSFSFSTALFVYAIIQIVSNKTLGNEFFEILYFGIHLLINFTVLALMYKAIRDESFVIKPLSKGYDGVSIRGNKAFIVAIVLEVLFTALMIYAVLITLGSGIYDFHFTLTLKLVLISVAVFMILSLSAFITYPIIYNTTKRS